MDIRPLTPAYSVSPQILPAEVAELAAAGYRTLICNRPDSEIPSEIRADEMRSAAEAAGLTFVVNPLVHGAMTEEILELQRSTIAKGEKTLAYCASGTRSTVAWMLGAAPETPPDALLAAAQRAGYQLEALRPQLQALYDAGHRR